MPYRLVLSADLMTVEFFGTLTQDELLSAWREMGEAEQRQSRAPDRLFLLLNVLEWQVTGEDIRQRAAKRREIQLPNPMKTAVVVQQPSHAVVARMFELLSHEIPHTTLKVFATLADARDWLGLL